MYLPLHGAKNIPGNGTFSWTSFFRAENGAESSAEHRHPSLGALLAPRSPMVPFLQQPFLLLYLIIATFSGARRDRGPTHHISTRGQRSKVLHGNMPTPVCSAFTLPPRVAKDGPIQLCFYGVQSQKCHLNLFFPTFLKCYKVSQR